MAFLAGPSGKGGVDFLFEELRIFRRVRVMAASAIDQRRIDVQVRLCKRSLLEIMALAAQGLHGLQEKSRLLRKMGAMASQAVPGGRGVGTVLLHSLFQRLMASEAKAGALGLKELVQIRLVGVVASCTLSAGKRVVYARIPFHACFQFGMALETKRFLFRNDHPPYIRCVGIVAS
jgi:hypothetical protein